MSKTRDTSLPQHHYNQGHYGELPTSALPSSTEPSGSTFLWDGSSWYFGEAGTTGPWELVSGPIWKAISGAQNFQSDDQTAHVYMHDNYIEIGGGSLWFAADDSGDNVFWFSDANGVVMPNSSSDGTAYNGQIYYNDATHKFRSYVSGSWQDLSSIAQDASINFVFDGGGATITTGIKADIVIDFDCTIQSVTMLADQTGSIVVDIWKDTYANFPPDNADSITASATPTISSDVKSQDATLTGWTTSITAGDILRFNVDSATSITRCTLDLKVQRT